MTTQSCFDMLRSTFGSFVLAGALIAGAVNATFAADSEVNINTASAELIAQELVGVGQSKAYRIVEYREAHGPFESTDELIEVKGIGESILERNRDRIVIQ